jgi:hypothetical protein
MKFTFARAFLFLGLSLTGAIATSKSAPDRWWSPGEERVLPTELEYENALGKLRILRTGDVSPARRLDEPCRGNGT